MPKVAFVLATLLAAEGAVFAHPIISARGYGSPEIVRRAQAPDVLTLDFAPWSVTHYLYNEIVNSLEPPTPGSQRSHVARDLSDQEDIKIRDYWEDENSFARRELDDELMERELDGGELDARDSDVILVPRGGKHRGGRRRRRRKPRPGVKAKNPPPLNHDAVAEEQEVTATPAERPNTSIPPEAPNKAGQDETAGSGGSNPSLFRKIWKHPLVQNGIDAASTALRNYADNGGKGDPRMGDDDGGYY